MKAGVPAGPQGALQPASEGQPKSFGSHARQDHSHGCHSGHPKAVLKAVMETLQQMPNEFAQGEESLAEQIATSSFALITAHLLKPATDAAEKQPMTVMGHCQDPAFHLDQSLI